MLGGGGNDTLISGLGKNTMKGGGGDDTLQLQTGDAVMVGGSGADTFTFSNAIGKARIKDFDHAEGDVMQLLFLSADDFLDIQNNSKTRKGDLIIDLDDAKIIVNDLTKAQLDADMFEFSLF